MLYIVATPIGNLEDITLRALRILGEVDFILAEDTRKTGFLLKHFKIEKRLVSFFEHNEIKKIPWVIEELKEGKDIALVSSAGTPTISDPGYKLIRTCRKENLPLTSLPGPSSLSNALALTSMPHDKFTFLGYLPRKKGKRKTLLEEAKKAGLTTIFFESPFRLLSSLKDLKEIFGSQKVAILREMSKKFEQVLELSPQDALSYLAKSKLKGELVLVVGKPSSK
jgi:16S rRNA (cytidine1402-2'-O)-methyltransferase